MYVSFLQDGFSRHILGFTVVASKTVELVARTLVQAVSVRWRPNLDAVADSLIRRPRKTLSWRSPAEVCAETVAMTDRNRRVGVDVLAPHVDEHRSGRAGPTGVGDPESEPGQQHAADPGRDEGQTEVG